jgi:hypothetical protein
MLAAALMLVWLGTFVGQLADVPREPARKDVASREAVEAGYVATIVSVSDDSRLNGERTATAIRLTPGGYDLSSGSVGLQFDGGARLFFQGQARFTLESRRRLRVDRGTFVFAGDELCESIEIATPHSVIRNLGTVYAAVIDADGEDVHVSKGAVQRTIGERTTSPRKEYIEAGTARRFGGEDIDAISIPLDEALVEKSLQTSNAEALSTRAIVVDDFRGGQERIRGLRSGRGWAEPWRSARDEMRLVSPGLRGERSFALQHNGSENGQDGHRVAAHRRLESSLDLSRDGIWYLRFLVRRGPAKSKDEHRAMVVLRAHGLTAEEEIARGALLQIALRRDDVAFVRLAGTLNRVSIPQVPNQIYAVVAKIVAGESKPEQVLVRVMAAERLAASQEPTDWSLVSDSVHTDIRLDQISLECVSGGQITFGDVCIGPTWESIVTAGMDQ